MIKPFYRLKFNILQVIGIFLFFKFIEDKTRWCTKEIFSTENQNLVLTNSEKTDDAVVEQELLVVHLCQGSHDALSLKESCRTFFK